MLRSEIMNASSRVTLVDAELTSAAVNVVYVLIILLYKVCEKRQATHSTTHG